MKKIAILGTGQAALSYYAYFRSQNLSVGIYVDSDHPGCFRELNNELKVNGICQGTYDLQGIVTDLSALLAESELIFIVAPTYAHQYYFERIEPYVSSQHFIFTVTANFSSLFIPQSLKEHKNRIVDIHLSTFACRFNGELNMLGQKTHAYAASLAGEDDAEVFDILKEIYPSQIIRCKNTLEVSLNNVNAICHPGIMILNAGRFSENGQPFYFNKEGVNKNIADVLLSLEQERLSIGRSLGLELDGFLTIMKNSYDVEYNKMEDFFTQTEALNKSRLCPKGIGGRYFDEDIGYLLVPWYSIAKHVGVEAQTIQSIIHLGSVLNQRDYFNEGRKISTHEVRCSPSKSDDD